MRLAYGFILSLCLWALPAVGQKHDYVWLSGYDSQIGFDSLAGFYFGASVIDFNYQPKQISYDSIEMNFSFANTSFSDSTGELLFYSNGTYIANSLDEVVFNGDSINKGFLYFSNPSIYQNGWRISQGLISLPYPGHSNKYFILHSFLDSSQTFLIYGKRTYCTLIDMSANNGLGEVIFKDIILAENYEGLATELSAVKHGNGRDWWILVQKRNSNCFYKLLLNGNGIENNGIECTGGYMNNREIGSSCFSPNGSKFVYLHIKYGLNIYDFDRCTGVLNNTLNIPLSIFADSIWLGIGTSISPNNRYLYVSATKYIYQFDLHAIDIATSKQTVAIYDGFQAPAPAGTFFSTMQLGPDGKIYISCGNTVLNYHVIENPDIGGIGCQVNQHSVLLPSPSAGVPNFPNYRLTELAGSSCDTLTSLNEIPADKLLQVYPNPSTDYLFADYGYLPWDKYKNDITLQITDAAGRIIHQQGLPKYSGIQKLDVQSNSPGLYYLSLMHNQQTIATRKWVKGQ